MYARAFADGFLEGKNADGGRSAAATAEQKEAVKLGLEDGSKTAGSYGAAAPAIGRELLRRLGTMTRSSMREHGWTHEASGPDRRLELA